MGLIHAIQSNGPLHPVNVVAPSPDVEKLRLTNSHLYCKKWAQWMLSAVSTLGKVCSHQRWSGLLDLWLECEDLLGYPHSQGD
jgi:hypothetical protein